MDIITALTMAAGAPATGDQFPVVPLIIGIGIAAALAIGLSVVAAVKKNKDDDDE